MAKFLILVTSPHYDTGAANTTYHFVKAAQEAEHEVLGVFFHQAGVSHANGFNTLLSDEPSSKSLWEELAQQYQIKLLLCATAASRRGILDNEDAKQLKGKTTNLAPHFTMSGLTEFAVLSSQADRVVQF